MRSPDRAPLLPIRGHVGASEASFEELYHQHAPFLARMLVRDDVSPESARDLHQTILLDLILWMRGHETLKNVPAMLVTLGGHELCNHARARRRRPVADGGASAEVALGPEDCEGASHAADCAWMVEEILAGMTPGGRRELIRLVDLEGLTCAEVAAQQAHAPEP